MSRPQRTDAGLAAAGLFSRPSATGGLAPPPPAPPPPGFSPPRGPPGGRPPGEPVTVTRTISSTVQRLRQGVELLAADVDFLRELSRPNRTGQPRTLGSKFVASGSSRQRF